MPWKTFALGDLPAVPKEIHLDGARFDEAVRIEGPAGGPKPRVIAPEQRPTFARGVALTNVDVQDLLLVGNVIQTIEFWNVDWPRRRGHYVLCDEIVFRRSKRMPPSGLREAYQALKRKYEDKGDHTRAGDFHYGEMEMKPREYGFPRRWLSWGFAYWMLSGYGIGHVRSLVILVALVSAFAGLHYLTIPEAFKDFSEALRYSIGVAALQRPEMPDEFDADGLDLLRVSLRFSSRATPISVATMGATPAARFVPFQTCSASDPAGTRSVVAA